MCKLMQIEKCVHCKFMIKSITKLRCAHPKNIEKHGGVLVLKNDEFYTIPDDCPLEDACLVENDRAFKLIDKLKEKGYFCKITISPSGGENGVWFSFGKENALSLMQNFSAPTIYAAALKAIAYIKAQEIAEGAEYGLSICEFLDRWNRDIKTSNC